MTLPFSRSVSLLAFAATCLSLSNNASATTISPGTTSAPASLVNVTPTSTVASVSGTFTADTFSGRYTAYVYQDSTNVYGINDLTYAISVASDPGSHNIEHITLGIAKGDPGNAFAMYPAVNAGYDFATGAYGAVTPLTLTETLDGTVGFNFGDLIAGMGSAWLVIQTPSTNYKAGSIGVIDSSGTTAAGFIPAAVGYTPEPSTLMLLGTGVLGVVGVLRRRGA